MPFADTLMGRIDAYDRRQFKRCKVEFGDWRGLFFAKANAALRRLAKDAPGLEMPKQLDPLAQEQWREIVRLHDPQWQKQMDMSARQWQEALAHGRPRVKLSPEEVEALTNPKVSLAQKSRLMAKGNEHKARRYRYAVRKAGTYKKVER